MLKIDISNKHKHRFIAFVQSNNKIIICSDTLTKLMRYLKDHKLTNYVIYDKAGNVVAKQIPITFSKLPIIIILLFLAREVISCVLSI